MRPAPLPNPSALPAAPVLDWYDVHCRPLPWRAPGTSPWAVLVCEVMSQQTPVNRVIPAWREWLRRWPAPADLAAASPAEVLRAWGKLGYPRRALRLREAAATITSTHGGQVPADVDALLALPGIGAYTARAVAAFAYGHRVPVVDTNVRRVAARCVRGRAHAPGPSTSELTEFAALLPAGDTPAEVARAVRFNAAVMELGALVCTAREPRCAQCPLAAQCAWLAAGKPAGVAPRRAPQTFTGTDRQVRGLILDVLRDGHAAAGLGETEHFWVPRERLAQVWPDPVQWARALDSLLDDGLCTEHDGHYSLPS